VVLRERVPVRILRNGAFEVGLELIEGGELLG
jgi:hypothetical protein